MTITLEAIAEMRALADYPGELTDEEQRRLYGWFRRHSKTLFDLAERSLAPSSNAEVVREITDAQLDAALAAQDAAMSEMMTCQQCHGCGYHHGFGEHGHDPDWCDTCGGAGAVSDFDERECMRAVLTAALDAKDRDKEWKPTHRHVKTGGLYRVLYTHALFEWDLRQAVIYDAESGAIWIRPADEFYDGRFEPVAKDREPAKAHCCHDVPMDEHCEKCADNYGNGRPTKDSIYGDTPVAQPAERTVEEIAEEIADSVSISKEIRPHLISRIAVALRMKCYKIEDLEARNEHLSKEIVAERERTKAEREEELVEVIKARARELMKTEMLERRCVELEAALNEVVTNGSWTDGEQLGDWTITWAVYQMANAALSSGTPHLDKLLADARREERERCAKLAENKYPPYWSHTLAGKEIANDIRSLPAEPKEG
jgi:hypothetical protein